MTTHAPGPTLLAQASGPPPEDATLPPGGEFCALIAVVLAAGLAFLFFRAAKQRPAPTKHVGSRARRERDERLAELVAASRDADNPLDPVAVVAQLQAIQEEYEAHAGVTS